MGRNYRSNRRGSTASIAKQMQAFDALPRSVRHALREAYGDYAPFPIRRNWEAGNYKDVNHVIRTIATADAEEIAAARADLDAYLRRNDAKPRRTKKSGGNTGR